MRIRNAFITRPVIVATTAAVLLLSSAVLVYAAQSTIDSTTHTDENRHLGPGYKTVFVSGSVGYYFYVDSDGSCVYSKTSNSGTSWGTAVTVDSQTDCQAIRVWYDQWTPGDTSGTYIHVSTIDSGSDDVWYTRLDTSSDTLTTTVNATGANQGGSFNGGENVQTITKGTDGTLYMSVADSSDSFVIECSTTCTSAVNWSETGTNPLDTVNNDFSSLIPLSGGNILLINHDASANVLRSKVWNGSSWSAGWTTIASNVDENTFYGMSWGVSVDKSTNDVYLAYIDDVSASGSDDDIHTAVYSSGSWSAKTDVLTNDVRGITSVTLGYDGNTGDIYVGYSAYANLSSPTLANMYWKKSVDGMTTWGEEFGPINSSTHFIFSVNLVPYSEDIMYATWYDDSSNDVFGNLVSNLFDASAGLTLTGNVKFAGNLTIISSLSKGSGTFAIDHPQDPKNKILFHSFVESPDVKNIYDGVAELNENGEATITLPDYFEALNKDFRYQFFAIDEAMPNLHISREVENNQFTIAGGEPGGEVSWQVTGIRHDPYILANPIHTEVWKGPGAIVDQGECIFKPLCE
jgi:hypothetical protein